MENQPDLHSQNPELSKAAAIEAYARDRMAQGKVLTWSYDEARNKVMLYVPNDADLNYPDEIAGVITELTPLPRPAPFGEKANPHAINYHAVVRAYERLVADEQEAQNED